MKYTKLFVLLLILSALLLAACGNAQEPAVQTEFQTQPAPVETTQAPEAPAQPDHTADYVWQIGRYYAALAEKWDEGKYFENAMSELASWYYEGNPLENVGYAFADMDSDGDMELIIGAIQNAQADPAVFEIWTLVDGEPVMLAQSGSRNRYYLEYTQEDDLWLIANVASNGAANSAHHYYSLSQDRLNVAQAVILDALADAENPWFLAVDDDWDTSNDTPVDEETALSIIEAHNGAYFVPAYTPFSQYG